MATRTTNYNLMKPTAGEPADISVINGNMDIIDTELKSQDQRINSAETAANDVPNKINKPTTNSNGIMGQILKTNGDGTTKWEDPISTDQIAPTVVEWMDENISGTSSPVAVSLGNDKYKLVFGGSS